MFRGLSSWLGLQQPAVDGRQSQGDGQPEGDAPPKPHSEAAAESPGEFVQQARDLGGECPPGLDSAGECPPPSFSPPWDTDLTGRGGIGGGRCRSPLRKGEVGEELGKGQA